MVAKAISLPLFGDEGESDCLLENLNLIDFDLVSEDFEFGDERSVDLNNWQLIKAADLNPLNNFDVMPLATDEVVLCSCEDVGEGCGISLTDEVLNAATPVENTGMMIAPVRLGLDAVSIVNGSLVNSKALLDSGALNNFISEELVLEIKIQVIPKIDSYSVLLADKRTKLKVEFQTMPIKLVLGSHIEDISFDVMSTLSYPIIIGLTWLKLHNPIVDWKQHTIAFG